MFNKSQIDLKLLGRNEGKIKSYKSCVDVRAWSHDTHVRDHYLRDWIKSDMPICVVPVCTVAGLIRNMSWRRRKKITPRCHPECKSKVVLDSICNSCHAIKECLKNEQAFDQYFVEEEFETTHWPCERCLEALKAIKMFWKIILEKIFRIDNTKSELSGPCTSTESIKTVAHIWQSEIIERALIVKTLLCDRHRTWYREKSEIKVNQNMTCCKDMGTEMDNLQNKNSSHKALSTCTSAVVKTTEFGCNTCISNGKIDENKRIEHLKQRFNLQNDELRILKRENMALKLELETMSKNMPSYTQLNVSDSNNIVAPLPYESCSESDNVVKDFDSELIITLKNCKDTNFKHVSMLQVLHKTNNMASESFCGSRCKKNEDPNKMLSKVHEAFREMIDREQKFVNEKNMYRKDFNINASFNEVNTNKSHQSNPYSAKPSHSTISDSIFVSTTEVL